MTRRMRFRQGLTHTDGLLRACQPGIRFQNDPLKEPFSTATVACIIFAIHRENT